MCCKPDRGLLAERSTGVHGGRIASHYDVMRRAACLGAVLLAIAAAGCMNPGHSTVQAFGNLGSAINSPYDDFAPVLSDSATLLFTSNRVESGEATLRSLNRANRPARIYFSMRLADQWDAAQPYRLLFDAPQAESATIASAPAGSPFNIVAYVSACDRPDTLGRCDIYGIVQRESTVMVNLGKDVNSASWEGYPFVTPDGRYLYFASDRPGGHGGSDIWVSELQATGIWGPPRNLGPPVNTAGDEISPFLDPATGTLYFAASAGGNGFDLFTFERNAAERRRLPAPYNSDADDISPFVSGNTLYLSSSRPGGRGGLDLYGFQLPSR
ncbi:MAG: PD40 domain-containing protein [Bacteroidetes bacterium]|nr:PD40 domain-containing protein [Bacteroidota bacterium]